jgi:hypothetical protein
VVREVGYVGCTSLFPAATAARLESAHDADWPREPGRRGAMSGWHAAAILAAARREFT